ncbi:MutS-related protein [Pseudobacter ginsenosidimutans]|uniref:MutS-like protein n=1 Tax=Pseudobacter ginsenosidimutans TaxID=661488 RepID=A0A4Q7MZW7_9BACT|nr:DNA mismatch repair protein [Pseudobacter ginsenosidimutans]RZS74851.1 MutS-like protein [Pseudobacter ginsenosidimutans]
MSFIADQQTLTDLNLTGRYNTHSIYNLFNKTVTEGGASLLDEMFQYPLVNADEINQRGRVIRFFQEEARFPLSNNQVKALEDYLSTKGEKLALNSYIHSGRSWLWRTLGIDDTYDNHRMVLLSSIGALNKLRVYFNNLLEKPTGELFDQRIGEICAAFNDQRLGWLKEAGDIQNHSVLKLARFDHCLRHTFYQQMQKLMKLLFELDVYIAVGKVASERGFQFATALHADDNLLVFEDLKHPALENGKGNGLALNSDRNVLFLTGANMAGKSTFMKSVAIAVYLAHMGFPVAARQMRLSVRDGIFSSINVPDNLGQGYSHFYAEVLRVKQVALEVRAGKKLLVIFDELFKGTNVKDAFDATFSVTEAFSERRECLFVISTHIIEVGEVLQRQCNNILFSYLPTVMKGMTPTYTYKLEEGITADRHGMMILKNERIIESIEQDREISIA